MTKNTLAILLAHGPLVIEPTPVAEMIRSFAREYMDELHVSDEHAASINLSWIDDSTDMDDMRVRVSALVGDGN